MKLRSSLLAALLLYVPGLAWAHPHHQHPPPAQGQAGEAEVAPSPAREALEAPLSPLVERLLGDELLSEAERRALLIFHGQWDELGDLSPVEQIRLAVMRYEIEEDSLNALVDSLPLEAIGEAGLLLLIQADQLAGRCDESVEALADLDIGISMSDRLVLAQAFEGMGQYDRVLQLLGGVRDALDDEPDRFTSAADLTAAAEAILTLARLEGRPAADFHLANQLLSRAHEELDPLYWPAYVAEARLLFAKGNPAQGMEAVQQALSLNPLSSEALYLLGSMSTRYFNFDAADAALNTLRTINPNHPLADALEIEIALRQDEIPKAAELLSEAISRYPKHRRLHALNAATAALQYDDEAFAQAVERCDALAPGSPTAYAAAGQALADARQYALAEPQLIEAIARQPGASQPQLELGQLYMQAGRLEDAAAQLRIASALDPFHKDITNTLAVATEMLAYDTIETDRLIIRYKPGIDEVLARDMARFIPDAAGAIDARFGHQPPRKTQVDLMPDDEHFAVRITGMPDIWTIAACMGDVMAMTPPRPGPKRAFGTYNWLNVLGHEYTHVVNLSQTHNRVPHWFTEGCAVRQETTGRQYVQHQLLADSLLNDRLFEFDEVNWGFIRPTEPWHRSLAYAQSAWMIEYIEATYGWDAVLRLADQFASGAGDRAALEAAVGIETDQFMAEFLVWAQSQLEAWGMATFGQDDDPAVELRKAAQVAVENDGPRQAIEAVEAYRAVRPVDPWCDRQLALLAIALDEGERGLSALTNLDRLEGDVAEYAVELVSLHRRADRLEEAQHYAHRALLREPYNPTLRELAATVAVQSGDMDLAAFHIESLAMLEPDRAIHQRRLAVVYERLGRAEDAAQAREKAQAMEGVE